MMLPPKSRHMTHDEFVAVMASGAWTWRCADPSEHAHDDWRVVQMQMGVEAKPLIFLSVPEKDVA